MGHKLHFATADSARAEAFCQGQRAFLDGHAILMTWRFLNGLALFSITSRFFDDVALFSTVSRFFQYFQYLHQPVRSFILFKRLEHLLTIHMSRVQIPLPLLSLKKYYMVLRDICLALKLEIFFFTSGPFRSRNIRFRCDELFL